MYLIETYGFKVGDIVKARVRAHNKNGWGAFSQPNTGSAFIMAKPAKMKAPIEGSSTTFDRIEVIWTELTSLVETGGTYTIVSYHL